MKRNGLGETSRQSLALRKEFILSCFKRREEKGTPNKRVGASKNPHNTKPSPVPRNVEKPKSEPPKLKSIATEHIEKKKR